MRRNPLGAICRVGFVALKGATCDSSFAVFLSNSTPRSPHVFAFHPLSFDRTAPPSRIDEPALNASDACPTVIRNSTSAGGWPGSCFAAAGRDDARESTRAAIRE
jgi:hypothetical protein